MLYQHFADYEPLRRHKRSTVSRCCTVLYHCQLQAYRHLWQTLVRRILYLFWCTRLASEVTRSHSPWLLRVGTREGHYWQKVRAGEELTQQIGEFADCKRGSNEIIKKVINSLWGAHNWACGAVAVILTCYQCHIAGNWRSLVLSHHNRRFSSMP